MSAFSKGLSEVYHNCVLIYLNKKPLVAIPYNRFQSVNTILENYAELYGFSASELTAVLIGMVETPNPMLDKVFTGEISLPTGYHWGYNSQAVRIIKFDDKNVWLEGNDGRRYKKSRFHTYTNLWSLG